MKKFTILSFVCVLFTATFSFAQVMTVSDAVKKDLPSFAPGKLVAFVPSHVRSNEHMQILESWGYTQTRKTVSFGNFQLNSFQATDRSAAKGVMDAVSTFNNTFTRSSGVKLIPNYIFRINNVNDPLFNRKDQYTDREGNSHDILLQWDMNNPGEFGGIPTASLHVLQAWELLKKANIKSDKPIVVAVVDTGIDVDHPALKGRIYKKDGKVIGKDLTDWFGSGTKFLDDHGHGSHCAGSIAAAYNDNEGITGSSGPANIKIVAVKALMKEGGGDLLTIANAIKWSATSQADIISMSLGAVPIVPEQEPILKEVFDSIFADTVLKNTIPIAAAGNNGKEIHAFPAFCDSVIAIGASDHQDKPAVFSNFGDWVDVMAPGVNIVSVRGKFDNRYLDMYQDAGHKKAEYAIGNEAGQEYSKRQYFIASGTSMACPNAAGVVALMLSVNPSLKGDTDKVRQILIETSEGKGTFKIGEDGGRINAYKALVKALQR